MQTLAHEAGISHSQSDGEIPFGLEPVRLPKPRSRWTDEAVERANAQQAAVEEGTVEDTIRNAAARFLATPGVAGCWFSRCTAWNFPGGGAVVTEAYCARVRTKSGDDVQCTDEDLGTLIGTVETRLADKLRPRPAGAHSAAAMYGEALEAAAATDTEGAVAA